MTSYLVTGTGRGLGLALVQQILKLPNTGLIIATARSEPTPALKKVIDESDGKVKFAKLTVTDVASVEQAVKDVTSLLGAHKLDVLVNNAGVNTRTGRLVDSPADEMERLLGTNVIGVHNVTRAFVPLLREGKRKTILNISSIMGSIGQADESYPASPYKVSKGALNALTIWWARDLRDEGFAVCPISPGWLKTDMGGEYAPLTVEFGSGKVVEVLEKITAKDNGTFFDYDGKTIQWHGARLDAANNQWHLTSPTPYDTPITYGGWIQSRALGARIASLLDSRDLSGPHDTGPLNRENDPGLSAVAEGDANGVGTGSRAADRPKHGHHSRRRKRRVVIHTSPFLRCVQTSIAISAGMAQYHGMTHAHMTAHPTRSAHLHSESPKLNAVGASNVEHLASIPEPARDVPAPARQRQHKQRVFRKPVLRVDAFLGEWLNPDYFDMITPPPSSVLMVAGAKADLLRTGDYDQSAVESSGRPSAGFPGGWGSAAPIEGPMSSMSSVAQALPLLNRSSSHNSGAGHAGRSGTAGPKLATAPPHENGGYVPLAPTYAISPSDPIPPGYVTHARDACVEVDYQWDSMREPQNWGSGGEYGEEWGAMHKRYRRATQEMLSWYRKHGVAERPRHGARRGRAEYEDDGDDDDDDDVEVVLILVSHGAGCNAIIGGLTDRTVLLDVGMASLTMAVRKDMTQGAPESPGAGADERPNVFRRKSAVSIPVSEDYDVKLMASTEHLRPGSSALATPHPTPSSPLITSRLKHGHGANSFEEGFSIGEAGARPATSSAIGSIRRTSKSPSAAVSRSYTAGPAGGGSLNGLWKRGNSGENTDDDGSVGPGDDMVLNFGEAEPAPVKVKVTEPSPRPGEALARTSSQRGLWGSSAVAEERKETEGMPKRRWTVNERERERAR
ncbi:MAG: hypothetical protein M1832_005526 [Thelocarpon impressellum]|nr:MAG: hypothetical protein M1832_005526 [Thelocarpon impressellum]